MRVLVILILVSALIGSGCEKAQLTPLPASAQYVFLSHTRHAERDKQELTPEVQALSFQDYDMLLLGGDLLFNSSKDSATTQYLDSVFHLSKPTTLLAAGNHDMKNPALLEAITHRPLHYIYHQDGIAFVVWNTQVDNCNITGAQRAELQVLAQNLDGVEQVVILHHKLIWMPGHPELGNQIGQVSNAGICNQPYCLFLNNFYEDIYPILTGIQEQGIPVVLLGGDLGNRTRYYEYQTLEGIWFLASGIQQGELDNQAIILEKNLQSRKLTWESVLLKDL